MARPALKNFLGRKAAGVGDASGDGPPSGWPPLAGRRSPVEVSLQRLRRDKPYNLCT